MCLKGKKTKVKPDAKSIECAKCGAVVDKGKKDKICKPRKVKVD